MRLSPVLVTVVAITAPFGSSLGANAQTLNNSNSNQTAEVLKPLTSLQHKVVGVFPASAPIGKPEVMMPISTEKSTTTSPLSSSQQTAEALKPLTSPQHKVVAILPASAPTATKKVILPRSFTSSKTAQTFPQTPTPETQQQTPPQAPGTTPAPDNTNPPAVEPGQTSPQTPPNIQQQQTPPQAPGTTPVPDSTNPPAVEPGQTSPQTPTPETQQQTPPPPGDPTQPPTEPTSPQIPGSPQPEQAPEAAEPRVLVSEVLVRPETGQLPPELEDQVYRVIRTQPGRTTTRSQLQEDINSIFATGFFSNVQALPEDTDLGVRVSFVVRPNPVLTKVQIQANPGSNVPSVLPANTTDEIFKEQYGRILNLRELQEGIKQLTKRYQDQGYVLANVIGAPQVAENGVVTLQVAEGVVEDIRVQFRNKEGQETNDKGQPIRGRTQPYIVTREIELKPGQVFNRNTVQRDLQRVFGLGLFEDVNVSLNPGTNPSQAVVVVNVVERNTGTIGAGAGLSSASGLFGSVSYQQQNLNGRNQKLGAEVQLGTRGDFLFDLRYTDPWIAGDPYRTSYTTNLFRRRSISLIFEGDDENIRTFNPNNPTDEGDRPRVIRLGGGVNFTRPLSRNPFERAEWTASAGLQYQRVTIKDADGDTRRLGRLEDTSELVDLSQSGEGKDDLLLLQLGAARDLRNNPLQPTSGSYLRFGVDQSVPIGLGNIFLTRLRGSYSQYIPIDLTNFTKGPETLAFNVQGGTILGDLPPYEAFSLGGSNSVRGYDEGGLGSGRSFVQASVEYRFPVFSVVSGALFFDVGSDLGSSTRVSDLLNKNGTGYGFGVGVRVQSPLGPIRIDYGINDDGDSRINFGIGERF
jgi:outer membrane protein insertion porin family